MSIKSLESLLDPVIAEIHCGGDLVEAALFTLRDLADQLPQYEEWNYEAEIISIETLMTDIRAALNFHRSQ